MKAVVFYENGEVDKLKYADMEKPKISPYEVLVKVKACALNHFIIFVLILYCFFFCFFFSKKKTV